ncbi:MAG: hypothetical protein ACC656_14445, partial [Candidatus Heimdallarchaeota archaeon]
MRKSKNKSVNMKVNKNEASEPLDLDLSFTGKSDLLPVIGDKNNDSLSNIASSTRQIKNMKEISLLGNTALQHKKIIHSEMLDHRLADKFRDIRTKLLNVSKNKNFMLMITSVCNFGGASTVASNLASAFSFDDSKTSLLVDCNLRNPKLHDIFDVDLDCGLTDYLENQSMDID